MRYVQQAETVTLQPGGSTTILFPKEGPVEQVSLWLEPQSAPTTDSLLWNVAINGNNLAVPASANNAYMTRVWAEAGILPSQNIASLSAIISNEDSVAIVVRVIWVALIRQLVT